MRPELAARLTARWVRRYTRDLPADVAGRRVAEIDADLHEHVAHERAHGVSERRIALGVASRMVRGVLADASWRGHQMATTDRPSTAEALMTLLTTDPRTLYRLAAGLALGSTLMLFWLIGAVGVIGETGDRADMMYLAVFGTFVLGAPAARLRASAMARVLTVMAGVVGVITVIALAQGRHESPITSVWELVGLNGFFAGLFLASAWLFRLSAGRRQPRPVRPSSGEPL